MVPIASNCIRAESGSAAYVVQVPEECPQAIADLVDTCLNESPAARPTAQQIFDIISSTL